MRMILFCCLLLLMAAGCGKDPGSTDDGVTSIRTSPETDRIYGRLGVIAYSRSTGATGVITNTGTLTEVLKQAIAECGHDDCAGVLWVERNCGVLAVAATDKHHGAAAAGEAHGFAAAGEAHGFAAYAATVQSAAAMALGQCRQTCGDCRVAAYVCS